MQRIELQKAIQGKVIQKGESRRFRHCPLNKVMAIFEETFQSVCPYLLIYRHELGDYFPAVLFEYRGKAYLYAWSPDAKFTKLVEYETLDEAFSHSRKIPVFT